MPKSWCGGVFNRGLVKLLDPVSELNPFDHFGQVAIGAGQILRHFLFAAHHQSEDHCQRDVLRFRTALGFSAVRFRTVAKTLKTRIKFVID